METINSAAAKNQTFRNEMIKRIDEPYLAENLKTDAFIIDMLDPVINQIEHKIKSITKLHHSKRFLILQTIPGIGELTALIIIYETHDIARFPNAGKYASYCRTVHCERTSNGKRKKSVNQKIGNPYLKWAFGQILHNARMAEQEIDKLYLKLERKKGKKIARAIMAHKFNTAAYFMMKNEQVFDLNKFLNKK
jgi:transposase